MVTLKELADECNVSIATISNILNGKSNVSEETKKRVLDVVKQKGYTPNYMARGLRATKTRTIGLLVDDFGAFGTPEIIEGITSYCEKNDYRVLIETLRIFTSIRGPSELNSKEFHQKVNSTMQEMLAMRVDAIIYLAAYSRQIDYIPKDFPLPVVLAYATTDDEKIPCVIPDDLTASEEITEYLINHGGKNIAIIKGNEENIHSCLREQGFKNVMKKHGIPVKENLITNGNWDSKSGYEACKFIFKNEKPDSLFCFNDYMACGAYQFLAEQKLFPGKDINIVGFDNNKIAECLPPPLTTMGIGVYEIGTKSAELVFDLLNGKQITSQVFKIPCKLIERDSVAKIK